MTIREAMGPHIRTNIQHIAKAARTLNHTKLRHSNRTSRLRPGLSVLSFRQHLRINRHRQIANIQPHVARSFRNASTRTRVTLSHIRFNRKGLRFLKRQQRRQARLRRRHIRPARRFRIFIDNSQLTIGSPPMGNHTVTRNIHRIMTPKGRHMRQRNGKGHRHRHSTSRSVSPTPRTIDRNIITVANSSRRHSHQRRDHMATLTSNIVQRGPTRRQRHGVNRPERTRPNLLHSSRRTSPNTGRHTGHPFNNFFTSITIVLRATGRRRRNRQNPLAIQRISPNNRYGHHRRARQGPRHIGRSNITVAPVQIRRQARRSTCRQ